MQRYVLWGVILLLGGALLLVGLFWNPAGQEPAKHQVLSLQAKPTGGDFTLVSANGPLSLSDLHGQVVVLYFGYTWCPDICPTSLGMLSMALNELNEAEQEGLQVLFISVDPERDSIERLEEYSHYFHPKILGVTGSAEVLADVAKKYGAAYHRVEQPSETNYVVDHSADLYLIDRQGVLRETLSHGTEPEAILAALRRLL
ncbi:SCO family protein [Candidatus Endoriftia persephonae]|jgi:protein SCO1/2|uniref:SCO family protein n=2 Tax=Gammaproteobacteria TaxID=1236 RepID=A0A9J7A1R1_9GAMM|nr:SCO family protein [Candidatus Endoriftia persephone]EGW55346.1 cytochrome oxidase biogenesis protein Sco1/SenC/PrrC, putative copper metallochaperone [endosymbiont of Tevnia jerichonana (vent Tica)]USF88860.1 SCO family protein [Candidatus Endoriftia persephone]